MQTAFAMWRVSPAWEIRVEEEPNGRARRHRESVRHLRSPVIVAIAGQPLLLVRLGHQMRLAPEAAAAASVARNDIVDDQVAFAFVEALVDEDFEDGVVKLFPMLPVLVRPDVVDRLPEQRPGDVVARRPPLFPVAAAQFRLPNALLFIALRDRFPRQAHLPVA